MSTFLNLASIGNGLAFVLPCILSAVSKLNYPPTLWFYNTCCVFPVLHIFICYLSYWSSWIFPFQGYELPKEKCSSHCYSLLCLHSWHHIKNYEQYWYLNSENFFSLYHFESTHSKSPSFSSALEYTHYLTLCILLCFRVHKFIPKYLICYWCKNITVCPFLKLLRNSTIGTSLCQTKFFKMSQG